MRNIRKIISKQILMITVALTVSCVLLPMAKVHAETKQGEITRMQSQGDLTVMFTFDSEVVDITFISPSGAKVTASDENVEYAAGDLWCTYRIRDAAAGSWKAEYDLGSNSQITYSIIEDDYGLWIQYFKAGAVSDGRIPFSFEADFAGETILYQYEIYAVSTSDPASVTKIDSGSAGSGKEQTSEASLRDLSSDQYIFRLDVYYQEGDAEVFDSKNSEPVDYTNPDEANAIENCKATIYPDDLICELDWSEFVSWGCEAYRLTVSADQEQIYNATLQSDEKAESGVFPQGTKALSVKLAYKSYGIWSKELIKTINLEEVQLTNKTGEVSNSAQVEIGYDVPKKTPLHVIVNGEEGDYSVEGNGELSFDLNEGNNTLRVELPFDELLRYVIDTNVYYDATPPSIVLFDDLEGKTFYTDTVSILGKVTGAKILRILGEEITLADDGSFSYEAKLAGGENIIEIEAEDANGNKAMRALTLYRGGASLNDPAGLTGWMRYLPLFAALFVSLLIILLSLIFMRKKERAEKKGFGGKLVIWDILVASAGAVCFGQFMARYAQSHSVHFLEMAEKSASEAVGIIKMERIFGIATLACIAVLIISIVVTVIVMKRKKVDE